MPSRSSIAELAAMLPTDGVPEHAEARCRLWSRLQRQGVPVNLADGDRIMRVLQLGDCFRPVIHRALQAAGSVGSTGRDFHALLLKLRLYLELVVMFSGLLEDESADEQLGRAEFIDALPTLESWGAGGRGGPQGPLAHQSSSSGGPAPRQSCQAAPHHAMAPAGGRSQPGLPRANGGARAARPRLEERRRA